MRLDGRHALITEGMGTIGRAIAGAFQETGAQVTPLDRPEPEAREGFRWLPVDLRDPKAAEGAVDMAGPSDILVNNAALILNKPHGAFTLEEYEERVRVNSTAAFVLARRRFGHEGATVGVQPEPHLAHPEWAVGRLCALCRLQRGASRADQGTRARVGAAWHHGERHRSRRRGVGSRAPRPRRPAGGLRGLGDRAPVARAADPARGRGGACAVPGLGPGRDHQQPEHPYWRRVVW